MIPWFAASIFFDLEGIVPNFSMKNILHGEHYLEIQKFPIPTSAKLISYPRLIEVIDKGRSSIVVSAYTTKDAATGEDIFYNELSAFARGSGGFGGQSAHTFRGSASAIHQPPPRAPDAVVEQRTSEQQAALYRLTGDMTPMHIDPNTSKKSGFDIPILHGLCSLGFAGQHIFRTFGAFRNIKARFSGIVLPGQTLRTEMWKQENLVVFQTAVVETGERCISLAGAELVDSVKHKL